MDDERRISLRGPTNDEELAAWYGPIELAFSETWGAAERDAVRPFIELDRLINAFDGERAVGSSGAYSLQVTVPGGRPVPASGITGVGVVPDARRRGVLRRMMTWLLDDAAKRHEPIAVLWASEAAIYQRFGFGLATQVATFEFERAQVAFLDPLPTRDDVRIRLVDIEEAVPLATAVYEPIRAMVPGMVDRPEGEWSTFVLGDAEWMRGKDGPRQRVVVEMAGEPRAIATYRMNEAWDERGPKGTVVVDHAYALDSEATRYLWQWLCSIDLTTRVKVHRGPAPHPLQLLVREPRRLGVATRDGIWLRFVDLAAALAARRYAGERSVVLDVDDPLIASNAGRWEVASAGDGTVTVRHTRRAADVALDVGALGAIYLGAWRFSELAAAGRAHETRAGGLQRADALFATDRAPFCDSGF